MEGNRSLSSRIPIFKAGGYPKPKKCQGLKEEGNQITHIQCVMKYEFSQYGATVFSNLSQQLKNKIKIKNSQYEVILFFFLSHINDISYLKVSNATMLSKASRTMIPIPLNQVFQLLFMIQLRS